ncbi:MAG TPA: cache domain-containing protein, partial [Beijerinckiaceae bacterium]
MWNLLSLNKKIPTAIVGLTLVVAGGVGFASYVTAANRIGQISHGALRESVRASHAHLSSYLGVIEQDLKVVASSPATVEALHALRAGYRDLGEGRVAALHDAYVHANPHPVGQKHKLDAAPGAAPYHRAHARFHPWLRDVVEQRGYYDLFLFDREGDLVYTVFKELDFATNFAAGGGPWADTDLGRAFRDVRDAPAGRIAYFDFKSYAPSLDAPASFISTPIYENGAPVGVLAFQMPLDRINALLRASDDSGVTTETLLVGADGRLRNHSRFHSADDILKTRLDSAAVRAGLEGLATSLQGPDHRGEQRFQAVAPVDFHGVRWALLATELADEALAPLDAMRHAMLIAGLPMALAVVLMGKALGQTITQPLREIVEAMRRLAAGDLSSPPPSAERGD